MLTYRYYPLVKELTINNCKFKELVISSHYQENHDSYMNDEIIKDIV